jgi:hypothetical protein
MPTITSLPTLSTTSNLNNVVIPVVDNNSGTPVGKKVNTQYIVNSAVNAATAAAIIIASTASGYVGSAGATGNIGPLGYTGSAVPGYVGSQGASSITARTILVGTSTSLANNATGNLTIAGAPSYFLLSMGTSNSSWVRLYIDNASRIADASRSQGTDPTYGSGVIAEIITLGPTTQVITPSIAGFNNDSPPTSNIYCAVTNLSGATNNITVTLNVISLGV